MNSKTRDDRNSGSRNCYPVLDVNPVESGVYQWGDVTVEISPDASKIVIRQALSNVVVHGGFFQDVMNVLQRCCDQTEGEQSSAILLNTIQTSRSLPTCEWD